MKQLPIRLNARPPYRAPLGPVQHAIVYRCGVGSTGDYAVERVDFADEMPLPQPPDCRIAAHGADLLEIERHQSRTRAHSGGCAGRFDPGMAAADYKNIEIVHGIGALPKAGIHVKGACFT